MKSSKEGDSLAPFGGTHLVWHSLHLRRTGRCSCRALNWSGDGAVSAFSLPLRRRLPPRSSSASRGASRIVCFLLPGGTTRRRGAGWRFMSDDHTAKWMQNSEMKSPMELINEVPPITVDARVVACEGGTDPALGYPIEYISLDGGGPAVCKYCGLRYIQGDSHGHH